ncbi:hypothetical protein [Arthrobacter sp. 4R501]|uniref:hypothetical protein n=1 Tax=Arthrobacter sp. 4R501 TaxID=2058886 RepID=UPI000CE4BE91|nr:hypothetical protein [Arthrobacter sp. 4R501]
MTKEYAVWRLVHPRLWIDWHAARLSAGTDYPSPARVASSSAVLHDIGVVKSNTLGWSCMKSWTPGVQSVLLGIQGPALLTRPA